MPRRDQSTTSREMAILLRALGCVALPPREGVPDVDLAGIDWPTLLRLARWHRCEPLLSHALESAAVVPAEARLALRRASIGAAARAARVEQVLAATRRILAEGDIPFLLLKGPAIAHTAYPFPDLRPYDDLDLLLRPDDIIRAAQALREAGYRSLVPMQAAGLQHQIRAGWDHGMQDPTGTAVVELCTGVAPRFIAAPPGSALWSRAVTLTVAGAPIPAPCAADLLPLLALHGAKHLWSRLIWVADAAGLLARHGEAGRLVDDALRQARRAGCERLLLLMLELAAEAGVASPAASSGDRAVQRLAAQVHARWDSHVMTEPQGVGELLFHLRARERLRDRVRHVALLALTPSHGDRQWLPLPDRLYPLHYALRPLRLTMATVRKAASAARRARPSQR